MADTPSSICYALLVRPGQAMAAARRVRPVGLAILIAAAAVLSQHVAAAALGGGYPASLLGVVGFVSAALIEAVLAAVLWLALATTCHAVAGLFGGYGRLGTCFAVLGLASAPLVFAAPAANILLLLDVADAMFYWLIVAPALLLWAVVLAAVGLRQAYRISRGAAWGAVVLPVLMLVAGGMALGLFGLLYMTGTLLGVFKLAGMA